MSSVVAPFKKQEIKIYLIAHFAVEDSSQLKKLLKFITLTIKREFKEAADYNAQIAGMVYEKEEYALQNLEKPWDCYFVLKVPAQAIQEHANLQKRPDGTILLSAGFEPKVVAVKTQTSAYYLQPEEDEASSKNEGGNSIRSRRPGSLYRQAPANKWLSIVAAQNLLAKTKQPVLPLMKPKSYSVT